MLNDLMLVLVFIGMKASHSAVDSLIERPWDFDISAPKGLPVPRNQSIIPRLEGGEFLS